MRLLQRYCKLSNDRAILSYLLTAIVSIAIVLLPATAANADGLGDLFNSSAATQQKKFLTVDQAFSVVPMQKGTQLSVFMEITPGHYIYKDKIKLNLPEGVTASPFSFNQAAHFVNDPDFGQIEVFDQPQVTATTTLSNTTDTAINKATTLVWQGCAKAGLCYPPQRESVTIKLPAIAAIETGIQTETETKKIQQPNTSAIPLSTPTQIPKNDDVLYNDVLDNDVLDNVVPDNNKGAKVAVNSINDIAKLGQPTLTNRSASKENIESNSKNLENDIENSEGDTTAPLKNISSPMTSLSVLPQAMNTPQQQQSSLSNTVTEQNIVNPNNAVQHSVDVDLDPFGLAKHPEIALGLLFLAGLGLALTPCVLPMLPIVSNIIARQHKPSAIRGVLLTGGYVLGVSVAYGILGALVAIFGVSLGILGWLQNPIILLIFAAIFALLAFYMFEVVTIRLPRAISSRLQRFSQAGDKRLGSVSGSFIAGALSALVVSPCVSAPLFGALIAVSTIGNPLLGFAALFMLGLGLSMPLIILGATQGNLMPKAGAWMDWVKRGFALMLFAVSLLLVERVFFSVFMLLIWALWFLVVALWSWSWQGQGSLLTKAFGMLLGIWAVTLVMGAAMGNTDNWQPLKGIAINDEAASNNFAANYMPPANQQLNMTRQKPVITITSLNDLDKIIESQDKVLVDISAQWCIECRIMDKTLFLNPPQQLQQWQLVKLDITETNTNSQAVLERYQIPGPPVLLYYVGGKLQDRQIGEIKRDVFEQTLGLY